MGPLYFAPGVVSQTFAVSITNDTLYEASETVNLTLSSPVSATLGTPSAAVLTIIDDDTAPQVVLSGSTYTVGEAAGAATITATLSTVSGVTATVDYATSNGTAIAGSDYTTKTGTLTFAPGVVSQTFAVSITNDAAYEFNETLNINLTNAVSATLGTPNAAVLTILDDDPAPQVQFSNSAYGVKKSGGSATITATLSVASGITATVNYATSNGTAVAGIDYTARSGTLTFTPGVASATFTVPIINTVPPSADKAFTVTLTSPVSATLGAPATAVVTITNSSDLVVTTNTTLSAGVYTYTNVLVTNNAVLTLLGNTGTGSGVTINAASLQLDSGATISADSRGYGRASGPGAGNSSGASGGGGYGGQGGSGSGGTAGGAANGSVYQPTALGSGGGSSGQGGAGGGAIRLVVTGTTTLNGLVTANGASGTSSYADVGGGGAGGSIWIQTGILAGTGTLRADGGAGSLSGYNNAYGIGGGGSGGRIAIEYSSSSFSGSVHSYGGSSGGQYGGPGTMYWAPSGQPNTLKVDNAGHNGAAAGLVSGNYSFDNIALTNYGHLSVLGSTSVITLTGNNLTGDSTASGLAAYGTLNVPTTFTIQGITLDIRNFLTGDSTLVVGGASGNAGGLILRGNAPQHSFNALTVKTTGTLYAAALTQPVVFSATTMTIDSGGTVTGDGYGYSGTTTNGNGAGGGQGGNGGYVRGGGGGYGGHGGYGSLAGGSGYGNVYMPTDLGSGGGGAYAANNGATGGAGGGALHLIIGGNLTINGLISANGLAGGTASLAGTPYGAGGGSGGSIWISTTLLSLSSSGQIRVNGGASGGGGGAGGRIGLYYGAGSTISGSIQARGGTTSEAGYGTQIGGPGTVYFDPTRTLAVDNGGNNGPAAELVSGNYSFDNMTLTNYGHLSVLGSTSAMTLTTNNLVGDSTASTLAEAGTFIVPGTFTIQGVMLDVQNALTGDSSLTVGGAGGNAGGLILHGNAPQHTFNVLTVKATGTLYAAALTQPVVVTATTMTIDSGGTVTGNGYGYSGTTTNGNGTGGGQGGSSGYIRGGGGGYGGHGGFGSVNGGSGYGSVYTPTDLGSGGGGAYAANNGATGGNGGGALRLFVTGTLTVNGLISANGLAGGTASLAGVPYGAGGGSGGSIWISTQLFTLSSSGQIQANGGASGGGGGAGGRIGLYYGVGSTISGTIQSRGGATSELSYGTQHGGPGTVYFDPTRTLAVDNGGNNGAAAELVSGSYSFDNVTLTNYGHLSVLGSSSIISVTGNNLTGDSTTSTLAAYGTINVPATFNVQGLKLDIRNLLTGDSALTIGGDSGNAGGLILHDTAPQHAFNLLTVKATGTITAATTTQQLVLSANTLTIDALGKVSTDGYGYAGNSTGNGNGPGGGQGSTTCYTRAAGGGYGGKGGDGKNGSDQWCPIMDYAGGAKYGSISQPTDLGSAGGAGQAASANYPGANGGGAIHFNVAGTLTVNGLISGKGLDATGGNIGGPDEWNTGFGGGGGGSGGSIWITANTIAGSGNISVTGGSAYTSTQWGYYYGGGGGGGRIAFDVSSFGFGGDVVVSGGHGYYNGARGTIWGLPLDWRSALSSYDSAFKDCPCSKPKSQKYVADPINTLTGGLDYSHIDITFPALGGNLEFERSYASLATGLYSSTLGYGWTSNLDTRLILPTAPGGAPGKVLFKAHSANQYIFFIDGDGTFSPYPGVEADLVQGPGGVYTLTMSTQTRYVFDAQGKLTTWSDAAGHAWTYSYDGQNRLSRVTSGTRYIQLTYNGSGQIGTVADHTGRSVNFGYTNGDLTSFTDVLGNTWTYEYDGATHRLTRVVDPDGHTVERTEYDGQGRAIRQYDSNDQLTAELTYLGGGTTTIADSLGHTITETYDVRNTWVGESNSLGQSTAQTFEGNFQVNSATDQAGHNTQMGWSDDGVQLQSTTDALTQITRYGYDGLNNLAVVTDTRGFTTTYAYTGTLLTRGTDALGKSTLYTYTTAADSPQPPNLLKATSDPAGHTTTYTYSAFGQLVSSTDPAGQVTTYGYDSLGRVLTTTTAAGTGLQSVSINGYNAAGQVVTATRNYSPSRPQNDQHVFNLVTTYAYDKAQRLVRTTDTLGRSDWTCYDNAGRTVRTVQNASGDGGTPQTDPCNAAQYVPSSDPAFDRVSQTVYDTAGNVIATIDPSGKITRTYYDVLNRPVLVVDNLFGALITDTVAPDYNGNSPDQNVHSATAYDIAGNVQKTVDNAGKVNYFCYDALDRAVKTIQNPTVSDPCSPYEPSQAADQDVIQQTVYDEHGNVIATLDAAGRIARTYYDPLNRPSVFVQNLVGQAITVTIPASYDSARPDQNVGTQTDYDDAGRAYRQLDLTTGRSDWTCYDSTGRTLRTVQNASDANPCDPGYTPSGQPDQDIITNLTYDDGGQQIAITAPDGQVTRTYYDGDGRRVAEVVNLSGQPITTTTLPAFDPAHTDRNLITLWGYDELGRVVTTTASAGSSAQYMDWTCFDALGRAVRTVSNATGDGGTPQTNPCDAANYQPSSDPARDNVSQTVYDAAGNAIGQINAAGQIARTYYDGLHRPSIVVQNLTGQMITNTVPPTYNPTQADANVRQETRYDAGGRTFETVDNAGMVTHTDYDALGRPIAVTTDYAHGGPSTQTAYDKLGNATSQTDANGVVTAYTYDGLNRWTVALQNYRSGFAATPDQNVRTEFTYDAHGNRLTMADSDGHVTRYSYDALNRQVSITDPLSRTTYYQYNLLGLRTVITDAASAVTHFAYDGARRLTSIDYPAGTADVTYSYDAAGNRLSMTDGVGSTTWAYDLASHPLTMTAPLTGSLGYRYDRLGNRTQLIYPDGKIVTGTFSALNQMAGLSDWQSQASAFNYGPTGQPLTTTLPNGLTGVATYDTAHRLTGLNYTNITGTVGIYTYTLDARGNWQTAQEALLVPGGSITQTKAITYTYDHLYRATDVVYSLGIEFHYQYDAAGNVLTRTKILLGMTTVTTYTYDAANELLTAKDDSSSTVWHYAYDNNGSLLEVTPDGTPGAGARRYTYNAALQLVTAEQHDGSAYQTISQMSYDGLGQRRQVTAWAGGISVTTIYVVDPAQNGKVLAATSGGQTTFYVHGPAGPLAELTTSWGYYLTDGQGSVRQLTDAGGAVTLQRRYSPWGEILDQEGTGDFAWGYFGGLMDTASGLIYVGNGQYFDPATGRFLTRAAGPNSANPYVPWRADPLGAALGPAALLMLLRRRKGKADKWDRLLLAVILLASAGMALSACGTQGTEVNGNGNTATGCAITDPGNKECNPPTSPSTPSRTPGAPPTRIKSTATATATQTVTPPSCQTPSLTPTHIVEPGSTPSPSTTPDPRAGLTADGVAGYQGISALMSNKDAWWGIELSAEEAVAIMLRFEAGFLIQFPAVIEAATRKYNQFCGTGAWSADCFNGFWGYYQPIRQAGTVYLGRIIAFGNERGFSTYITAANKVIANPSIGGQLQDKPTGWVVILEENAILEVWNWATHIIQGSANNQAFLVYEYSEAVNLGGDQTPQPELRVALVMSFLQLSDASSPCRPVGKGCNLAQPPYTTQ